MLSRKDLLLSPSQKRGGMIVMTGVLQWLDGSSLEETGEAGEVALYNRECFDYIEIDDEDDKVVWLWERSRGRSAGQVSWWESVRDPPARNRLMRPSTSSWQKCHSHQPLCSWVTSACQMSAGNTTERNQPGGLLECVEDRFLISTTGK